MIDQLGPWSGSMLSVAAISILPFGVTVAMARRQASVRRFLPQLTGFGAGAVLGAAVAHIIPEALESGRPYWVVAAAVVAGYVGFWAVEKVLAGHDHAHAHGVPMGAPSAHESASDEAACEHVGPGKGAPRGLVPMTFAGDALHNVVDGMLIAAGFLAEPRIGLMTLLAVALHELPREVGTFSLFVHGGLHPMRAVQFNALTALLAMAGAAVTLLVGTQITAVGGLLLPVAAGTYLYIAKAVGTASLHDEHGDSPHVSRLAWFGAGFLVMVGAAFLH